MKRRSKRFLLIVGLAIVLALAISAIRVARYVPLPAPPESGARPVGSELGHLWRGVLHVHSEVSQDASGSVDDIIAAAAPAGLDFVVLTDHNPIGVPMRPDLAWRGNVLLIVGEEISTDEGHLLALDLPTHRYRLAPTFRDALGDIWDLGGWALVAHADHRREPWTGGWGGTHGLEVVNLAAVWSRAGWLRAATTVAASLVDPDWAALNLLGGPLSTDLWDALISLETDGSVRRPRVAVAGADAHGPLVGPIPPYAQTLSPLRMLVWTDHDPEPGTDAGLLAGEVLRSLRRGRAAIEVAATGDGRGFTFVARGPGNSIARMGELAAWESGPWTLEVGFAAAGPYKLVLLRDGVIVTESEQAPLRWQADRPGTYRVEFSVGGTATPATGPHGTPWLYGNPIYLWPPPARMAAELHRAPPLPPPPASVDLMGSASFAEHQLGVGANGVAREGGRLRWDFGLADGDRSGAYAAAVWAPEPAADWRGADGLVLGLESTMTLRINVELRTGADVSTRVWSASVKVGPEGVRTAIPWEWFRSVSGPPRSAGALLRDQLASVERLVFMVTPEILEPGAAATVWIDALGLY